MSNNLHELILAKRREIVWQKNGSPVESLKPIHERKAALMAMEELAGFYRTLSMTGWNYDPVSTEEWRRGVRSRTEEQLYEEYGRVKG